MNRPTQKPIKRFGAKNHNFKKVKLSIKIIIKKIAIAQNSFLQKKAPSFHEFIF
jgi:hypothetical protein